MADDLSDTADLVGSYPACPRCDARAVVRDAWTEWSSLTREWVLKTIFDTFACDTCGNTITPVWAIDEAFRTQRIRRLNDALRRGDCAKATVVITSGIQALGEAQLAQISAEVASFDAFDEGNDPHQEHDFGAITFEGEKLFWKIDYFDLSLQRHSPDAANPEVTHRVLTIMLASEY